MDRLPPIIFFVKIIEIFVSIISDFVNQTPDKKKSGRGIINIDFKI
jgi:hypothetical protein